MIGCSRLHGEYSLDKLNAALADGENPNAICLSGMTPLHWSRHGDATEALIKAGANVNAWDMHRTTPLHLAPDAKSVTLLLAHGANPNAKDKQGRTPFDTAKNQEVLQALQATGLGSVSQHKQYDYGRSDAFSSHSLHQLFTNALRPSFCVALAVLVLSFVFARRIHGFFLRLAHYTFGTLISGLLLLLNPLPWLVMLIVDVAKAFLYFFQWVPQWATDTMALPILAYLLCQYFLIRQAIYHGGSRFAVYCGAMMPYLALLPFYVLMGMTVTDRPGHGGDAALFLGLPLAIIMWIMGYQVSSMIVLASDHADLSTQRD